MQTQPKLKTLEPSPGLYRFVDELNIYITIHENGFERTLFVEKNLGKYILLWNSEFVSEQTFKAELIMLDNFCKGTSLFYKHHLGGRLLKVR